MPPPLAPRTPSCAACGYLASTFAPCDCILYPCGSASRVRVAVARLCLLAPAFAADSSALVSLSRWAHLVDMATVDEIRALMEKQKAELLELVPSPSP